MLMPGLWAMTSRVSASSLSAIAYVVTRILHPIFYAMDQDKLRSLAFLLGFVCVIMLFVKAANA
ncbi:MAG: MAPEG family protein [Deltaproteobacteria bacterium]|jgi:uncharacterized MAPEG superfamily protein|nr:MAPEG family protein [Deltaproteobacteria bacterium]